MGYFYILLLDTSKYYLGSTRNIAIREEFHKLGLTKTTKEKSFELIFSKEFPSYQEALYREKYIKKMKSRNVIEKILSGNWNREKNYKI